MKSLTVALLFLLLSFPVLASPWELAGKAPEDVEWVIAWNLEDSELLPFWEFALQIDSEIKTEDAPTLESMLAVANMSPEEVANSFDGTGFAWSSEDGQRYSVTLGLENDSGAYDKLVEMWESPHGREIGPLKIFYDKNQFTVSSGIPTGKQTQIRDGVEFKEAVSKLAQPASIVGFRNGTPQWKYAALSLDLQSETSLGVVAFHKSLNLDSESALEESLLSRRPEELRTILVLQPRQLPKALELFGDKLPQPLLQIRGFLLKMLAGEFLKIVEGPGLLGVDSDPLTMFLGESQQQTIYARGRYNNLSALESFLANLEYEARFQALEGCKTNLNHLIYALRRYEIDLKKKTPEDFAPLIPELLERVPSCPAAGRPTYAIEPSAEGSSVYCRGDHHPQNPPDYPRFDKKLGMVNGDFRKQPEIKHFSRVDDQGYARYQLVSGQRIEVGMATKSVALADGDSSRDFLSKGRSSTPLPELLAENLEWSDGRLLYLDYLDIAPGVEQMREPPETADRVTPMLLSAFREGLSQGKSLQASNVVRWDGDSLSYRGRGLWSAPVLLSSVAATPLWARANRRKQDLKIARRCRDNLQRLGQALTKFRDENGLFPDKLSQLVPRYMSSIPLCPVAEKDTYSKTYYWEHRTFGGNFPDRMIVEMCCLGHHHTNAGWGENEPRFDLQDGVLPKD